MTQAYNEAVELRHLRYFTAVAETGGLAVAARQLHVAQSAISEQIRDLEDEVGVPLFDRTNRRVRLTEHGEQFLEDSRAVLAAAARAVANARRSLRGEIGTLTVGFFVGGTGTFFPAIIREFRSRFPGVQVTLEEMAPGLQQRALQSGAIDIGFTRPLQAAETSTLHSEHFLTEPMYAVLLKGHRLASRPGIALRALAEDRFVMNERKYSPATFDKIITLCAESGFSPRIGTTATVSSGVIALVEAGEGVAVLPQGSKVLISQELAFLPLEERNAQIDLVLAWAQQREGPVLRSFLDLARAMRKKLASSSPESQTS